MYDALLYFFFSLSLSLAVAMYMQNQAASAAGPAAGIPTRAAWERYFIWREDGSHDDTLTALVAPANANPDLVAIIQRWNIAYDELDGDNNPIDVQRRASQYGHRYLRCILGHIFEPHIRLLDRLRILRAELEEIDRLAENQGLVLEEQRRLHARRTKQKLEKRATRRQEGHQSPSHSPPGHPSPPPPKASLVIPRFGDA